MTWISVEDVAERLGMHVDTIRRYLRDGIIDSGKVSKLGGRYYILEGAVDELLESHLVAESKPGPKGKTKAAKVKPKRARKRL